MNEFTAAVGLRLSIRATIGSTGNGQSLENIITNIFPDGAQCFVLENRSLYELDKESTATPDGVEVVQPIGGPGRWIRMTLAAGAAPLVEIVGTAENTVGAQGAAAFTVVGSTEFDWMPTGAPAGWALTAPGGVITYNGLVSTRALVTLTGSVYIADVEGSGTVWGAVSHNGDLTGLDPTVSFTPGTQATIASGTSLPEVIASQRLLTLAPGDTLQIVLATDAGENLTLSRATLAVLLR